MARASNGLTDRQDKFCTYYVRYTNGAKAAEKAGYKKRTARVTASELLTKPNILKVVRTRLRQARSRSIADTHEILLFFTNTMRAKTKEYDTGSGVDGDYRIEKPPDIRERLKAAEDLLKHENPLTRLQIAKAKADVEKVRAEAEIKKYEAKQNNSAQNKTINQTTKLLNKLENATKNTPKKD